MLRNLSSAFKVGILLLLAIVGGWFVWNTVVQRGSGSNGYKVYALFRDASGLVPRSRVTMAGIPVGTIQSIKLQNGMARVEMLVNRDIQLFDDATVSRKSSSLLGEYILVLTPGTESDKRIKDGDRIRVLQEGTSTDDILNNIKDITVRVRNTVDRVNDVFGSDEGRRQMADALRNIQELTAELNKTVQQNGEVVGHALRNVDNITTQAQPDVRAALQNSRSATERVDQILERNEDGIDDSVQNVQDVLRNANAASRDLREAISHINNISAGVDRGEGTIGKLVRDDAIVEEVQGIAEGVNDFIAPIARLQTIIGLRSEYNFIQGSLKSYVEIRLQPREDRYYLIELVDDPRGQPPARSSTNNTSSNPNDPRSWSTTTERVQNGFRFTVQIARRIGPVTLRFGIRESVGGAGLDLHFWNDRIEVRTDLFEFNTNALPRLRVAAAIEVIKRVWLIGGVDDILNNRRDGYLGLMLRFNDEDLKSILPFAGGLIGGAR